MVRRSTKHAKIGHSTKPSLHLPRLFQEAQAAYQANQLELATQLYQRILIEDPKHAEALTWLGTVYLRQGKLVLAIDHLRAATHANARQAIAHSHLGVALQATQHYAEAVKSYDCAIALNKNLAEAYSNRGYALSCLNEFSLAVVSFDQAILINPDYCEAYSNRGNVLFMLDRVADAVDSFERALALKSDYLDARTNLGVAYDALGFVDRALASFDDVIAKRSNHVEAHWNKALIFLREGEFARGWKEYEWRWELPSFANQKRDFQVPRWFGDAPISGKTILLYSEQGLGDTLQMLGYLPLLEARGAKIVLQVHSVLVPLLRSITGLHTPLTLLSKEASPSDLPTFDWHCPLLSLPLAFATLLTTIPSNQPYLRADVQKKSLWAQRLGTRTKPRIGLVFSGAPKHKNDFKRSIEASLFSKVLDERFEWHVLQKELRENDRETLKTMNLSLHGDALLDFSDTAALLDQLDLLISVDTSVVHLAGAMGKPVWVLLPYHADFRWLKDRIDSPWYPSARLFRQSMAGDWADVLTQLASALQEIH